MTWVISLFASPERAEAIVGDLEEEFRARTERGGVAAARVWYVRQALVTIPQLIASQLRATPLAIAAFGVVAVVLFNAVGRGLEWVAERLVTHYEVYAYIPAATFWSVVTTFEIYGLPVFVGWCIGKVARERAIASLVAMSAVVNVWMFVVNMTIRLPSDAYHVPMSEIVSQFLLRSMPATLLLIVGASVSRRRSVRAVSLG